MTSGDRTIVIGIGDPDRRDAGLGPAVISLLRDQCPGEASLVESTGELDELLSLWADGSLAVVVEAVRTHTASPGRIHRLAAHHPAGPRCAAITSGSGIAISDAMRLARELDRMPRRMLLFLVEAGEVAPGRGLTPPVAEAAVAVANEVAALLARPVRIG